MIKVTGMSKTFGKTEVLKNIDFEVNAGETVAILGPSGSGKTTFLRCLNFLERADAGTLEFDGEEFDFGRISKKNIMRLRQRTGFVFQNYNLFLNKTALQNITEGLVIGRKMPKDEAEEIGRRMLGKVGLPDKADFYPAQLSGGQQQRVGIARALATDPEIMYFDEPTSALDPELIGEVLSVIGDLSKEGRTMLIVTHEMNFAREVSDRIVFMENGVVLKNAPTKVFFEDPEDERIRSFLRTFSS